jgi:phosphatidylinositol kinase/protein kinase (PI-3  family)
MSLDALKKKPGYVSLAQHFSASYGAAGLKHFRIAQKNLANSLAAYSLVCYIFQIKDRLVYALLTHYRTHYRAHCQLL